MKVSIDRLLRSLYKYPLLWTFILFLILTLLTNGSNFIFSILKIKSNDFTFFIKTSLTLKILSGVIMSAIYTINFNERMTQSFKIKIYLYLMLIFGIILSLNYIKNNNWVDFWIIYSVHITTGLFIYTSLGFTNQILLKSGHTRPLNDKTPIPTKSWTTYKK